METAHALTIDVEEWFHDDWRPDRGADWDHLPSTVASDVALMLDLLGEAGFDPVYGARPLKRAIQHQIENPLAQQILAGDFAAGDTIEVDVEKGRFVFM